MEQPKRRRNKKNDMTQKLMMLIIVLVIVLVAVVTIAISVGGKDPSHSGSTNSTGSADATENTDQTEATSGTVIAPLNVTWPESTEIVTMDKELTVTGSSDPKMPVNINGTDVYSLQDGTFHHTVTLENGMNTLTITYNGVTSTYSVEYRYAVQSYYPAEATQYFCGATAKISVLARSGSTLTVSLGGKTIAMKEASDQLGSGAIEGFLLYTGTYQMPTTNDSDKEIGQIEYTVTCDGVTETYTSGTITCLKSADVLGSDPSVTPDSGDYMDVGSGYIVEILANSAETFLGTGTGDPSDPRMNYLPAGTVDYGSYADISNGSKLVRLRCGRRVYTMKSNYPSAGKINVVDSYKGTLPDHNEIGIASVSQSSAYTTLTFNVLWKAPFYLDLLPQRYANPDYNFKDYAVTSCTVEYVDITFCYATVFEGTVQFSGDNPIFSHAVLTQNEDDCTLRLYLKKAGHFYGWDSYYNEDGQLCFRFLNPAKATATDANRYGADLSGVRVMIDVGHGGLDGGAVATYNGKEVDEAYLNLLLAEKLRDELRSMGATVIMNRTDDSEINVEERIAYLKDQAPDICIAIHQNSIGGYPNIDGADVMYFTPYSQLLAKYLYQHTESTGVYSEVTLGTGVYYMARESVCPVVLMENGYMSNAAELEKMMDETVLLKKAQAMAAATAQYFLQINK